MAEGDAHYIVDKKVLPLVLLKTMEVKEVLKKGEASTIHEAVNKVGISRSAYYKYKDYIFPVYEMNKRKIITIYLLLSNSKGVLSSVLNLISDSSANVLTINQTMPSHGVAGVTIALEIKNMKMSIEDLMGDIRKMEGVHKINILAKE